VVPEGGQAGPKGCPESIGKEGLELVSIVLKLIGI